MNAPGMWTAECKCDLGTVFDEDGERICTMYRGEAMKVVEAHNKCVAAIRNAALEEAMAVLDETQIGYPLGKPIPQPLSVGEYKARIRALQSQPQQETP